MSIFTFTLNTTNKEHLYIQIYEYIKNEIENGNLKKGEKLPSTRQLSDHLQVSRNTVDTAYCQLLDEGYITAYPKRGFFINDIEGISPSFDQPYMTLESEDLDTITKENYTFEFSPYGVDLSSFPFATWRKIAKDIYYDDRNTALFQSGNPQGDLFFRQAIATYIHQSRGVNCSPEQIIVGAGVDYLLLLLAQILGQNAVYAMEDPSYGRSWKILNHVGATTIPVPMDAYGLSMEGLKRSNGNIAYVTPSHHFPLGILMPISRRIELLNWAYAAKDRYVIEDDYDSEFRYKGKPVPSLQGIDHRGKVIYLGTFSKAIAPAIRVAYLVLPDHLLKQYKKQFSFYACTVPRTEQKLLTNFIENGHFQRHLNRMRNLYKAKRDYILQAFLPYESKVTITGEASGLHLLLTFKDGRHSHDILKLTADASIGLYNLDAYYIKKHHMNIPDTVMLGYGTLSLEQLKEQIPLLLKVLFP